MPQIMNRMEFKSCKISSLKSIYTTSRKENRDKSGHKRVFTLITSQNCFTYKVAFFIKFHDHYSCK